MQTTITLAEVLNYLFGSTTLVAIFIAWKSRKSTIKQAEATALDSIDSIYTKMSNMLDKEITKMQQKYLELEEKLDQYVQQCSTCENNKIGKKK